MARTHEPVAVLGIGAMGHGMAASARPQRDGEHVTVLRGGHVNLNADDDGDEILARARADKWLEASESIGSRRFFLMDGDWFEIGADYVRASREAISRLFPPRRVFTSPRGTCRRGVPSTTTTQTPRSGGRDTCAWTGTHQCATHRERAAAWRSATYSARATSSSTKSAPGDPPR